MRHRRLTRHFGRTSSHREAMLQNLAISLLRHETIKTTLPKAKEVRKLVERLITKAKIDTVSKRRLAFSRLGDRDIVTKLFTNLGPRFKQRPGGYLRILKCGFRAGDNAPVAIMQLLDQEQNSVSA